MYNKGILDASPHTLTIYDSQSNSISSGLCFALLRVLRTGALCDSNGSMVIVKMKYLHAAAIHFIEENWRKLNANIK